MSVCHYLSVIECLCPPKIHMLEHSLEKHLYLGMGPLRFKEDKFRYSIHIDYICVLLCTENVDINKNKKGDREMT